MATEQVMGRLCRLQSLTGIVAGYVMNPCLLLPDSAAARSSWSKFGQRLLALTQYKKGLKQQLELLFSDGRAAVGRVSDSRLRLCKDGIACNRCFDIQIYADSRCSKR